MHSLTGFPTLITNMLTKCMVFFYTNFVKSGVLSILDLVFVTAGFPSVNARALIFVSGSSK